MRSFRHGVSIRLASITRESSGHGVVRFEGIELPVDEAEESGEETDTRTTTMRIDRRSSKFSSIIIRLDRRYTISPPLPQIFRNKRG